MALPVDKMTRAQRVIAFIEGFCIVPEGKLVGTMMVLDPFQKQFIYSVYDNHVPTQMGILSIARKNGKTGLIAALVLAHVVGPEAMLNSQVTSGALSKDQAALVFSLAAKMIAMSPTLSQLARIIPSGKRIIGLKKNVEYKALSSESTTAHGLSPVLAILDETGQVKGPTNPFIEAIVTAQGAHENPLLLVISTQAATDADMLSVWIDDAFKSWDPAIVCHLYAADKDAEIDDEAAWAAANPALGTFRSLADVRKLAARAQRMPSAENSFRNLILNQRVQLFSPFVSPSVWANNRGAPDKSFEDMTCVAGLDLSQALDLTAYHVTGVDYNGVQHWRTYFWTPLETLQDREERDKAPYNSWVRQGFLRATPGKIVDYAVVIRDIMDINESLGIHSISAIGFDRWRIEFLMKEAERLGIELPFEPFGQGFKDMSPAIEQVEANLVQALVRHGDNPVLTWCVSNAVVITDPSGNRKLDKAKSSGRIDGIVAAVMAQGMLSKELIDGEAGFETF